MQERHRTVEIRGSVRVARCSEIDGAENFRFALLPLLMGVCRGGSEQRTRQRDARSDSGGLDEPSDEHDFPYQETHMNCQLHKRDDFSIWNK